MSAFTLDASAEAEYFAKFKVSTQIQTRDTTREEIKRSSQQEIIDKVDEKTEIPQGYVAVLEALIQVMKDPSGNTWIYPTGTSDWGIYKLDDGKRFIGLYDFTAGFATEMNLHHQPTTPPNPLLRVLTE
jgi:hypothetical protein